MRKINRNMESKLEKAGMEKNLCVQKIIQLSELDTETTYFNFYPQCVS